jgi:hypothetical protein
MAGGPVGTVRETIEPIALFSDDLRRLWSIPSGAELSLPAPSRVNSAPLSRHRVMAIRPPLTNSPPPAGRGSYRGKCVNATKLPQPLLRSR